MRSLGMKSNNIIKLTTSLQLINGIRGLRKSVITNCQVMPDLNVSLVKSSTGQDKNRKLQKNIQLKQELIAFETHSLLR